MKSLKTVVISLIALVCVVLAFTIHWLFMLPAAFLSWYGWKVLNK